MGCSPSVPAAARVPAKYQIATGNYASVTKITMKAADAAKAAQLLAAKVPTFMSWEGVVAVHNVMVSETEMWFVGVYQDAAALESNAQNVKGVLADFAPMMGAPPDRVVGKVHSVAKGPLAGPIAPGHAAAVTKIKIAPGKFAEAEAILEAKLPEFATWKGIVSFTAVQVSEELLATVAVYEDKESLAANADNVKAALGALGPLLAGAPARESGVVTLNGDGPDIAAIKRLIDTFQAGYFNGKSVEVATAECAFNPPGAPPMPIEMLCGMLAGVKQAFPEWTSVCHGVSLNADGQYEVLTQQCIGPMKGDLPAMGPFPAVKLADVPKIMHSDIRLPVEVGTWTFSADGTKVASGAYAGATKEVKGARVTPAVAAMWNKKGDLSDVGFGCLFSLMGVTLPPPPAPEPSVPEGVAFFFNGEKMAGKAEKLLGEYYADSHILSFIGPYAPPVPPLDKEHLQGAIGNLLASFPDLTFNFTNVAVEKGADGGYKADIVVMGTHTGAAFTPMPGKLPAIETTGTQVKIGPETFTLYVDGEGKVVKTTIEPLHEGAPAGPPGFYTEIGGMMPVAKPELPPSPTKAVVAASAA